MSLNSGRHGLPEKEFDELEKAYSKLGIDFYLIGAVAREIWFVRGGKKFRSTKDVDFAILVADSIQYEQLKQYLIDNAGFTPSHENAFVLFSPARVEVDILPFGEIEMGGQVQIAGMGMTNISVDGFLEVFQAGTAEVETEAGQQFKAATLPAIILLKLIAFDDRPEQRTKDARDIANIIQHYFELQADFIYENHADIFTDDAGMESMSLQQISGIVIGRELKRIARNNSALTERLTYIINKHIGLAEKSSFVRNMVEETAIDVEAATAWLTAIRQGLS